MQADPDSLDAIWYSCRGRWKPRFRPVPYRILCKRF